LLPDDHKDSNGNPFWSGPKRSPIIVIFDQNDAAHVAFVFNAANLIAVSLGISPERDQAKFAKIVAKTKANPYVQKKISVETPEEAKQREAEGRQAPAPEDGEDDE